MKLNHSVLMASVLVLGVTVALAMPGSGSDTGQQPQSTIETTHVILPITIEQAVQAKTEQSTQSQRDQFQNHSRTITQTQDHARALLKSATDRAFSVDDTTRQHKDLKESVESLRQEHAQLTQRLTQEQQTSARLRNASLLQAHDRLQKLVQEIESELSDSVLHAKDVADKARATHREMRTYQKEFRAMSRDLGIILN